MATVRKIGLLTHTSKNFLKCLESQLPKNGYHLQEIMFDQEKINNSKDCKEVEAALEKMKNDVESMDIVIADGRLMPKILHKVNKVKWIHLIWAGVDPVVDSLAGKSIPSMPVTRFGGYFGEHMAEYAISHIVGYERGSFTIYENQKQNNWLKLSEQLGEYRMIKDLKFTILGCGDIGHTIARHLKQFGGTVYGMVRQTRNSNSSDYVDQYFTFDELPEFLKKSDYVCNVLPSTPGTRNLLTPELLKNCQNTVFMNLGRGDVIKEDNILRALEENRFKQAILDVFAVEPLPKESKLWSHERVTITPHCSGQTQIQETVASFLEQLKLFENNEPLEFLVDWKSGY
ncbi:glyoxylate/hydroxypyruvate reductase A-like isoform X1 [Clytia hemisphaerica]|uniref:D-isomer specific 2-hydroxyacid dehydrogenase NAD-binding domain-containing protein n=2 Tax=Clytia hemisphaerica TaxID=252671 RepID=A0A7M5V2D2_9CNID